MGVLAGAASPLRAVRRWGPWAALAVVAAVVLALGAHRASPTGLDAEVEHIAGLVRCPVCAGETAAQSQSPPSVEIRAQIRKDLQAGMNQGRILGALERDYGPSILEKPSTHGVSLVVWVAPVAAAALGGVVLVVVLRRWRSAAALPGSPGQTRAATRRRRLGGALPSAARRLLGSRPAALGKRRRRWAVAGIGVAALSGGAAWALVSSIGTRAAGQPITGQAVGAQAVQAGLHSAANDASRGNVLGALKEYQKILGADPTQVDALAQEGWLLAETQQPALLKEGIRLLSKAEKIDPGYAPAHVYRGIAYLSEDDYAQSIPELRWYLAHSPDPRLAPQVRAALAKAEALAAQR